MKMLPIFTDFIIFEYLDVDNDDIAKFCYAEEKRHDGKVKSNRGGWQSKDLYEADIASSPAFVKLYNEVEERFREIYRLANYNTKDYSIHNANCWININRKHNSNQLHNHPNSLFSAVYYVEAPENSGNLIFERSIDPACRLEYPNFQDQYNEFNSKLWVVNPERGKVIFFPSWLNHVVEPSISEKDRISIAFNSDVI